jgi:hypothetical protein
MSSANNPSFPFCGKRRIFAFMLRGFFSREMWILRSRQDILRGNVDFPAAGSYFPREMWIFQRTSLTGNNA